VFDRDHETNRNILELTVGDDACRDSLSVVTILKAAPILATISSCRSSRDDDGHDDDGVDIYPIEMACTNEVPREVIMAIALVDLPIDLDATGEDSLKVRDGYGASWWYLTCDCDDAYVDIVKEMMAICTYPQKRKLCLLNEGSITRMRNRKSKRGDSSDGGGTSLIKRASPRCKLELRKALRFAGRYEFTGNSVSSSSSVEEESKVFEVLDFGSANEPIEDGRIAHLKYYAQAETYENHTEVLKSLTMDNLTAHIHIFCANALESDIPPTNTISQSNGTITPSPKSYPRSNDITTPTATGVGPTPTTAPPPIIGPW